MPCQNKNHAIEGNSRLQEGRTEVVQSMVARGDRKLRANDCRGASWSELTATPWSWAWTGAEWIRRLLNTVDPSFSNYKNCAIALVSMCSYATLIWLRNRLIKRTRRLLFSRNVVLSGRALYANSCIAISICSGRVITLWSFVVVPQVWTELLHGTAVKFQHGVSLVSFAIHILSDNLQFL